ncbi:stage II sporulation protein M [Evansella sp. LMS18]|jgi:stage II sporulation protein M|uniref:stage II sporulation protein M n=1 Tax=Evansella sp. LMS18 TaxID=2924033 RepID=UPI0020D01D90|nr:stage II sporulation protein M [Evansella sp. LMS18]UTR09542.1 stage II sporulation protein M [Evansella sp. LMS18]
MKRGRTAKLVLISHIEEHRSIYMFSIVLLSMGVIFGAVIVNSLGLTQKSELYNYLSLFFSQVEVGEFAVPAEIFSGTFSHYIKYLGLMWVLGLSVIGLPIIFILLFLKGLVIGFTVGFLVNQMGFDGFLLAFAAIFPQNLMLIPVFITVTVFAASFSIKVWRQITTKNQEPIFRHFLMYTIFLAATAAAIAVVSAYEAYLSPAIMKLVFGWIS